MTNIILFDSEVRDQLLPLTFTRPIEELRIGILSIREKWEYFLKGKASYITQDYLAAKYPTQIADENIVINGAILPNSTLCQMIERLSLNEALLQKGNFIAAKLNEAQFLHLMNDEAIDTLEGLELQGHTPIHRIEHLWDIYKLNHIAIETDFQLLTKNRTSQPISNTNRVMAAQNIFLEEGATIECSNLNATSGPIYLGKNATIMEGCSIRGGFSLGEQATLKMGANIYGPTTIGPYCKVGGEVKNSVIMGYSNKSHAGYLGNSVLGEWCNLGADTNNSNLKNNYSKVRVWSYDAEQFVNSGEQFCGLFMGDHSKTGINTMFNTGTVVGVFANVFGAGFPSKHIPSFSWGGVQKSATYELEKAMELGRKVYERRNLSFHENEQSIIRTIFEQTRKHRTWDKDKEAAIGQPMNVK